MAFIPTSNILIASTSAAIGNADVPTGQSILILPTITVSNATKTAIEITHPAMSVRIDGTVIAADRAVDLDSALDSGFNYTVSIGSQGVVTSDIGFALYLGSNNDFVDQTGNQITLNNDGSITSLREGAVLAFNAEFATVNNSGSISTLADSGLFKSALHFFGIENISVVNTGTIESTQPDNGSGDGTIHANSSSGIFDLVNHGHILSLGRAIDSRVLVSDTVRNHGVIEGDIRLANSVGSQLTNAGLIAGDVDLQGGDDFFRTLGDGFVDGTVFGGAGNDRFVVGLAEETFVGGDGNDTLDFRGGPAVQVALDQSIASTGRALGDTYTAFENLQGSGLSDMLIGSSGNNGIRGYQGNDTISGGSGNDGLFGGRGTDRLTGGAGNDSFSYVALSEFGDVVNDFSASAAGNNDRFVFTASGIGGGLAAGTLAGSRFQTRADNLAQDADDRFILRTTDKTLWFDVDGTGTQAAVMVANMQSSATMTAADILLV
jgi:Ca2+-binding RTX toxin-like protein